MHIFVLTILAFFAHIFASAYVNGFINDSPLIAERASCVGNYNSDEWQFFHNGMRCCKCFIHCNCFGQCVGNYSVCFPEDTPRHPHTSIDRAWHELMKGILSAKKAGPFFIIDRIPLERLVNYNETERNIDSIEDYLQIIEKFRARISNARLDGIRLYKSLYTLPSEKAKLKENLKRIELEYKAANKILDAIPSRVISLYQKAIMSCSHTNVFSIYNKGLIHSLEGNWEGAVDDMQALINLAEKKEIKSLDSKVYLSCGEACLEVSLFHEAIDALTKAINKNPENKQAYFFRASAYFESGKFDKAIQDYLMSDKGNSIFTPHKASQNFKTALINSIRQAASEAIVEFAPSLCSSVYGLGTTIWAAHPLNPQALENVGNFADACYAAGECVVDYCKHVDKDTLNECIGQIKILHERFDQLSDTEKGELIGHAVGKYGVDIIATSLVGAGTGIAIAKGNQLLIKGNIAHKNLRNANRACTLETMASSKANKEIVSSSALKHATDREYYFKNIRYNFDAHNKHILGHNDYDSLRSIWDHPDPEGLLKKLGGKGHPERGIPGQPGFKETVDFGEYIGIWKSEDGAMSLPTTRGTIHYGNKGAHIVPVHPNPKYKKLEK